MKTAKKVLAVIIAISFVALLVCSWMKDTDYSNAYYLHKEVSSLDSLEETIKYFEDNRIPYQLKGDTFSAESGKLSYTISAENELIPSDDLLIFSKLEEGDQVTTVTKKIDGEYVKVHSLAANGKTYYQEGEHKYYTSDNPHITTAAFSCAVIGIIGCIVYMMLIVVTPTEREED